jgi:hypothetical protein
MALDHVRSNVNVHPLRHGFVFGVEWVHKLLDLYKLRFRFYFYGWRIQLHFLHCRQVRQ